VTRDRVFLALAFVWLAATAWLRPLAVPDEGRYVGVAWEMIRSGDWLVPTLDGLPYFHKPPLFYWLTAAALSVWDSHLAARIAPWMGGCLAASSLFLFVRRWVSREVAIASLVAMVTAPLVFFGAQYANLDMLVAGCITATILGFAHAALLDPAAPERDRALLIAYALAALGVLAKGLIGIVLPGMVLFLWLAWERRWVTMLRLLWLPGIVLFIVITAPWFIAMQERFPAFMHYFFVVQHFQRFSAGGFNNARPFWFYIAVLALLVLPWTAWLAGARAANWRGDSTLVSVRRLMVVWIAAITLFFSLPASKLVGYILPVVAPLVFIAVDAAWSWRDRFPRAWRATRYLAAGICLVAAFVISMKADRSQQEIARALRDRMQADDSVIALEDYWFAIDYEARLPKPMFVVADWSPEAVASRDNWRRELADAAVFAPSQDWLVAEAQFVPRICAMKGTAWLVGDERIAGKYKWLQQADKALASRRLVLWRLAPDSTVRAQLCRETPSAISGGKS
jgi:4-amino-4-deoxy-L-arabinose transferase-like glycosyltransferase